MRVGTKSLLFGYHSFWLHPLLCLLAWRKLFGFPWDPRIWVCAFVHDLGYWNTPNMDGIEGSLHPFLGAWIMHFLFDGINQDHWYKEALYHSRTMANTYFGKLSRFGYADKLVFAYYPVWLLRALYWMSGELKEYMTKDGFLPPGSDTVLSKDNFQEWYNKAWEANLKTLKEIDYYEVDGVGICTSWKRHSG